MRRGRQAWLSIVFLENDGPARAQRGNELTQGVDRFGLVHEHPPANSSIEVVRFSGKRIEIALHEADVWIAERLGSLARSYYAIGRQSERLFRRRISGRNVK
jgi:hypothetical protein